MADRRPDYTFPLMLIWIALIVLAIQMRKSAHEIAAAKCPTTTAEKP